MSRRKNGEIRRLEAENEAARLRIIESADLGSMIASIASGAIDSGRPVGLASGWSVAGRFDAKPGAAPAPARGRQVVYRSRTGDYSCTATITATTGTLWREGVQRGDVPDLSSERHVHLHVLTPGAKVQYQEHDVPFSPETGDRQLPGSWSWPERV